MSQTPDPRYQPGLDNQATVKTQLQTLLDDTSPALKGRKLEGRRPQMAYTQRLLDAVISSLEKRFSDDEEIISATVIANLNNWPTKDKSAGNIFLIILSICL